MTSRPELQGLIERCEKATGPDRELDVAIWQALCWKDHYRDIAKGTVFTASLDASVALVERVLPGWHWSLDSFGEATAFDSSGAFLVAADDEHYGHNKHLPLAILAALLRSLLAREDSHV